MIEPTNGTTVLSPVICPGSTSHYSTGGAGGYHELPSLTRRNTLPVDAANRLHYDGMGSGHRRQGMLVVITADADPVNWPTYRLEVPNYEQLSPEQKVAGLANNTNWKKQVATEGGGPGSDGEDGAAAGSITVDNYAEIVALLTARELKPGTFYTFPYYGAYSGLGLSGGYAIQLNGQEYAYSSSKGVIDAALAAVEVEMLTVQAVTPGSFSQAVTSSLHNDILKFGFEYAVETSAANFSSNYDGTKAQYFPDYTLIELEPDNFYDPSGVESFESLLAPGNPYSMTFYGQDYSQRTVRYTPVDGVANTVRVEFNVEDYCGPGGFFYQIVVPGFLIGGLVTERHSLDSNIKANFDWRNVTFTRDEFTSPQGETLRGIWSAYFGQLGYQRGQRVRMKMLEPEFNNDPRNIEVYLVDGDIGYNSLTLQSRYQDINGLKVGSVGGHNHLVTARSFEAGSFRGVNCLPGAGSISGRVGGAIDQVFVYQDNSEIVVGGSISNTQMGATGYVRVAGDINNCGWRTTSLNSVVVLGDLNQAFFFAPVVDSVVTAGSFGGFYYEEINRAVLSAGEANGEVVSNYGDISMQFYGPGDKFVVKTNSNGNPIRVINNWQDELKIEAAAGFSPTLVTSDVPSNNVILGTAGEVITLNGDLGHYLVLRGVKIPVNGFNPAAPAYIKCYRISDRYSA